MYICTMGNGVKITKTSDKQDFIKEFNDIVDSSNTSVIIEIEWSKEGDYFQKLSMYDNNYTSVPTLGGTTLINTL